MQRHPSSTTPSQLSSIPLHVSWPGLTAPAHDPHAPPLHVCVPDLHAPTALPQRRTCPLAQAHPSSTTPLQFSSTDPSHTSVTGPTEPVHDPQVPLAQVCVPALHAPTLVPHDCTAPSTHEHPSSTVPSQLSSIPLHVSVVDVVAPVHTPHAPLAHVCVPVRHAPTLLPHRRRAPLVH